MDSDANTRPDPELPVMTPQEGAGRPVSEGVPSPAGSLRSLWDSQRFVLLADVAAVLLRRAWLVLGFPLVMGTAALLYFEFRGSYVAESSLTPEEASPSLGQFAGLAARFGGGLAGLAGQGEASVDFYAALLQSPALMADVAQSRIAFVKEPGDTDSVSGTLVQLFDLGGDDPADSLSRAVQKLLRRSSVSTDRLSNIITVTVKARWPAMAQAVNRRMLEVLRDFNLQKRQLRSSAERRFTERRLEQARAELTAAEESLERFLEANRTYQSSPRLAFDAARLQRRIELQQQVYTTLASAYEQARIEEVRDTPVFTIIERPELFTERSRSPVVMGLVAMVFFGAFATALTLVAEYLRLERLAHPESVSRVAEAMGPLVRRLVPRRRRAT